MDEGELSTLNACPSLLLGDYQLLYKCVILYYNDTLSEKPSWCNNERVLIWGDRDGWRFISCFGYNRKDKRVVN
jgi:hypothetical protein